MIFEYDLGIPAKDEAEAEKIFQAVKKLIKKIPADDMKFIGELTDTKGNWVPKAKPYAKML